MENEAPQDPGLDLPEAIVEKRKMRLSIVWLVPLVALLIGGWLVYKAISEKGPTITISFKTAEGLEAGKTKIKYKELEVGQVEKITLSPDISRVMVHAKLVKGTEKFLTENTRFWVVRARLSAHEVSGIGTLFSGAYIGIDPGSPGGKPKRDFTGLEIPPVITADLAGAQFALRASTLGSLDIGSPVYYRQIKVGQVVGYELEEAGRAVIIKIFINAPHHRLVKKNTRFWNASGLDVSLDVNGLRVNTESLVTLLLGGIAFDTPTNLEPGGPATPGDLFVLYDSHEKVFEKTYTQKLHWLLFFDGSLRGLTPGAPVEFRGIRVGKVLDVSLELDPETQECRIPVLIETEPARFWPKGESYSEAKQKALVSTLVEKGLRARLKTGNLITGKLLVDLDLYPNAEKAQIDWSGKYPTLPTLPGPAEEIFASLNRLLARLESLPIEAIGQDLGKAARGANHLMNAPELREAVTNLNKAMQQTQVLMAHLDAVAPDLRSGVGQLSTASARLNELVQKLNDQVAPALSETLIQAQGAISGIKGFISTDTALYHELKQTLSEIAGAARSIRVAADLLNLQPEALIYGKEGER